MNEIQMIKQGTSVLRTSVPNKQKINAETLKYVPQKVKKVISQTDVLSFRQYMLALKNNTKVTQDEIKELFSYDGEEFEAKAYDFLIKKLRIPENITPPSRKVPKIVVNLPFAYDYSRNIIYISQQNQTQDKASYLALLRHELQHFLQNIQVLSSEEIGEKAIAYYAEELSKSELQKCDYMARNLTLEQIQQNGINEDGIKIYTELKKSLQEGNMQEYEKDLEIIKKSIYDSLFAEWTNLRQTIIAEMGTIKEGTKAWKRAEKFFCDIKSSYFTSDNKLDYGKYFLQCTENEAIVAQDMMYLNVKGEPYCYTKIISEGWEQLSKSEDEQITEINDSLAKKAEETTFKDLLVYLFD